MAMTEQRLTQQAIQPRSGQANASQQLIDDFGRRINYVRISVTDRCDFRCVYCMSEEMTFLPREQVLTLEELAMVARAFTELGVEKFVSPAANRWYAVISLSWSTKSARCRA
ncbi:hypothetical protein HSBAA_58710 [Vreelandella sulfidaeris]|uniref:Radical SAM core domain-containing protein n=1 Tax=Vreelandella sulfidaeris TaxID=115553 RepID=A0A455UEP2_9GAMM|nr:hypothetical protein HSBAA_58710 [Halomonas sulfidaeris]